ncbi:hypothetical protein K4L04_03915 [Phaeobacter inhibens]|uniref:hypothetical protein n=1 Tax=Phaeobacter inhibens TaxID=221822 RepID=UPI0021A4C4BB|nr:hypothetical protein [Phaeobacter inhibens]UWR77115.1 hypothetical protein K4L04_03915 [Phaeobacter inhibens]
MTAAISSAYSIASVITELADLSNDHSVASVKRLGKEYMIRITETLDGELSAVFDGLFRDPLLLDWLPLSSDHRDALIRLLTKISLDFAFYHEIGHILPGHADKLGSSNLALQELEFVKRKRPSLASKVTRQVWEYEADVVAAGHVAMDAARLIRELQADDVPESLREIFGPPQIAVEQVGSLTIVACYTLFRHLRETAIELDMESYHPDPLVRAFIVRDALYSALSSEFTINDELFEILLGARFEEFDHALEENGIRAGFTLDDRGIEHVNVEMSKLVQHANSYRIQNPDMGYVSW